MGMMEKLKRELNKMLEDVNEEIEDFKEIYGVNYDYGFNGSYSDAYQYGVERSELYTRKKMLKTFINMIEN